MMEKQNKIILIDIDDTMFNKDLLKKTNRKVFELYEEVYSSLEALAQVATLGIFSQGQVAFQLKKLHKTNIHHYFEEEHMHIVEDKIEVTKELLQTYSGRGKMFIVEDRLDVLEMAKTCNPTVFTIWMKRKYAKEQRVPTAYIPDATVLDLSEVLSIVEDN